MGHRCRLTALGYELRHLPCCRGAPWRATLSVTAASASRAPQPQEQLPALQETPLKQYRAFRRMHARNEKFDQEAWIEAWTELDGRRFRYEIVERARLRLHPQQGAEDAARA